MKSNIPERKPLAITSTVIGGIALLLSIVAVVAPIIFAVLPLIFSFILAFIALILGIIAILSNKENRKTLSYTGTSLAAVSFIVCTVCFFVLSFRINLFNSSISGERQTKMTAKKETDSNSESKSKDESTSSDESNEKVSDTKLLDNEQVTISYNSNSNYFTIKNKTASPINLGNGDGPILNGHLINMYDGFASVSVPANASTEEHIELSDAGETLGGDKLHEYDYVKNGDNLLHVSGDISDKDFNAISSYSFDAHIDSSLLKDSE